MIQNFDAKFQALKISDEDLDSVSWHEVQKRLIGAQSEHLMCIHKDHLTELDIYHRILRYLSKHGTSRRCSSLKGEI